MWRLRKLAGWTFGIECFFFAFLVWCVHYPPQYGQTFIRGGGASPPFTIIGLCAFYFAVISTLGIAWWTIRKEKASSRIWGVAASIASLFVYVDPSYWYVIQRKGVWVHWAVCLLGLIIFLVPQPERTAADRVRDGLDEKLPNAGICYVWGLVFPLLYLLTRRRNKQDTFLRFHCIQCITLYSLGALCILIDRGWARQVSGVALLVIMLIYFVTLYNAVKHKRFRLPLISAFAEWLT